MCDFCYRKIQLHLPLPDYFSLTCTELRGNEMFLEPEKGACCDTKLVGIPYFKILPFWRKF